MTTKPLRELPEFLLLSLSSPSAGAATPSAPDPPDAAAPGVRLYEAIEEEQLPDPLHLNPGLLVRYLDDDAEDARSTYFGDGDHDVGPDPTS